MAILRFRVPLLALVWLTTAPLAWDARQGDWHFFTAGRRELGLHVFARHPELHMGPLSLVAAGVLRGLGPAEAAMWLLAPLTLVLLARSRADCGSAWAGVTLLLGGAVLLRTWALAGGQMGHLDDVLAMTFTAVAVWGVDRRRPSVVWVAVALAAAAKPWGVMVLPLAAAPVFGRPWRSLAAATALTALPWLPFELADSRTLSTSSFDQGNEAASALRALGVRSDAMPHWDRPAQVLLAVAVGLVVARRGHWGGVVAVAMAVRIALDPAIYGYYTPTLVLGALALDLLAFRRPLPLASLGTYLGIVVAPWVVHDPATLGRLRLLTAALVALGALATVRIRPAAGVDLEHVRHAPNLV